MLLVVLEVELLAVACPVLNQYLGQMVFLMVLLVVVVLL